MMTGAGRRSESQVGRRVDERPLAGRASSIDYLVHRYLFAHFALVSGLAYGRSKSGEE